MTIESMATYWKDPWQNANDEILWKLSDRQHILLISMRTDEKIEGIINEAAERAASFYYEKTKEDMHLLLVTLEAIQVSLEVAAANA